MKRRPSSAGSKSSGPSRSKFKTKSKSKPKSSGKRKPTTETTRAEGLVDPQGRPLILPPRGLAKPSERPAGQKRLPRSAMPRLPKDDSPDDDEEMIEVRRPSGRSQDRTQSPSPPQSRSQSQPQRKGLTGRMRPKAEPPMRLAPATRVRASIPEAPERVATHVVSLETLARATTDLAEVVEEAVLGKGKHADRAIAAFLKERRDLGQPDKMFASQAVFALFRWKGWLDPLHLDRLDARLLFAWLLDAQVVHPVCKVWARSLGRDPARLVSLGGAPNWTARADGWKRLHEGIAVTADPWRLFPPWLKENLPMPPGTATPKLRFLEFLNALQTRPALWVRAQGAEPKSVWQALGEAGHRPWLHRRMDHAARLPTEANVHHMEIFKKGSMEIQDLASQAVGLACDPDPGERWWDACAGAGGKSLHLSALMEGKGLVVATDVIEGKLKETIRRARRSPFRNVTTKVWDGKHVAGKAGSFDGVLVDAPCSAIGTWRRNPDARWTLDKQAIARLAETQAQVLRAAAAGVRKGGTLVYSVCTLTPAETVDVIRPFLAERPEFKLDPFPHPLQGTPTDGTVTIWPQEAENDSMFIARMVRSG